MIRALIEYTFADGKKYAEFAGMSSDTKPTEGFVTGSKMTEIDTGIVFFFDEESRLWFASNTGNGKTLITSATVTLGAAVSYDGTEKTKGVTSVVLGTTTLTEDTDYIVTDNKATEVGDYTLHIVGIGSYTGAIAKEWSIVKGTGSVTASPDTLELTDTAGTSTLSVTGDGEITVESSAVAVATASVSGTTVTVTPVAAGSATITVTLAGTDHYTGGTDTISVTVSEPESGEG